MFSAAYGESAVARTSEGDCSLDLRGANVALLEGAGVEDIAVVGDCTCCSRALGSFRREGPERFTRMLAYMGRR
jgi:copper oxidase (laccase) domain-containing protein